MGTYNANLRVWRGDPDGGGIVTADGDDDSRVDGCNPSAGISAIGDRKSVV